MRIVLLFPALLLALCLVPGVTIAGEKPAAMPEELGHVKWERDLKAAVTRAKELKLDLLVQFQEVPGWRTCKVYGRQVLTHPLLVEAAESLFVPLAVHNNTKGDADEATLKLFKETAWNNPVVRFVTPERKDIARRHADDWSLGGLATAMIAARKEKKRSVPRYLISLAREATSRRRGVEQAAFGMTWFWVGEAQLSLIKGVVATKPGWLQGVEVVEVTFDPKVIKLEDLIAKADKCQCASRVFTRTDAQQVLAAKKVGERAVRTDDKLRIDDDKYYTAQSELKYLPMTPLQATIVNQIVGEKQDPADELSSRQRALLSMIHANPKAGWPVAIGVEFRAAWTAAQAVAAKINAKGVR